MFGFSFNLACLLYIVVKRIGNFLSITMLLEREIDYIFFYKHLVSQHRAILLGLRYYIWN